LLECAPFLKSVQGGKAGKLVRVVEQLGQCGRNLGLTCIGILFGERLSGLSPCVVPRRSKFLKCSFCSVTLKIAPRTDARENKSRNDEKDRYARERSLSADPFPIVERPLEGTPGEKMDAEHGTEAILQNLVVRPTTVEAADEKGDPPHDKAEVWVHKSEEAV